jgi:hypothetical protein
MIALLTADIKFFQPLHFYKYEPEYRTDIVVIGEMNNKLMYIAVDRASEGVLTRHSITYKSNTTRLFNVYFPGLHHTDLILKHAFGFYRMNGTTVLTTIFIVQYHPGTKNYFLTQCNMTNHSASSMELIAIRKYLDTPNEFHDVMIRKSSVYTDDKVISDYDVYIMHIGFDDRGKKCVDGIRVLTTDDEKSEFESMYNLSLVKTVYPVVDQWSGKNFRFYDMPEDVEQHTFDFSTGMGVFRFTTDT